MAMTASVLGALMKSNIDALTDNQKKDRSAVFEALASAVIAHIQSHAVVAVTVTSVAGVTPGGGVSGPGAGTGTIS